MNRYGALESEALQTSPTTLVIGRYRTSLGNIERRRMPRFSVVHVGPTQHPIGAGPSHSVLLLEAGLPGHELRLVVAPATTDCPDHPPENRSRIPWTTHAQLP